MCVTRTARDRLPASGEQFISRHAHACIRVTRDYRGTIKFYRGRVANRRGTKLGIFRSTYASSDVALVRRMRNFVRQRLNDIITGVIAQRLRRMQ